MGVKQDPPNIWIKLVVLLVMVNLGCCLQWSETSLEVKSLRESGLDISPQSLICPSGIIHSLLIEGATWV